MVSARKRQPDPEKRWQWKLLFLPLLAGGATLGAAIANYTCFTQIVYIALGPAVLDRLRANLNVLQSNGLTRLVEGAAISAAIVLFLGYHRRTRGLAILLCLAGFAAILAPRFYRPAPKITFGTPSTQVRSPQDWGLGGRAQTSRDGAVSTPYDKPSDWPTVNEQIHGSLGSLFYPGARIDTDQPAMFSSETSYIYLDAYAPIDKVAAYYQNLTGNAAVDNSIFSTTTSRPGDGVWVTIYAKRKGVNTAIIFVPWEHGPTSPPDSWLPH